MKESKITIDELACMVAEGFNEVKDEIGKVKDEIGKVKNEVGGIKYELTQFREQNERDHLDFKLRQDNVAYRFELQDLDKRVTHLEKKVKIA